MSLLLQKDSYLRFKLVFILPAMENYSCPAPFCKKTELNMKEIGSSSIIVAFSYGNRSYNEYVIILKKYINVLITTEEPAL